LGRIIDWLFISRRPKNFTRGEGKYEGKVHPRTGHEGPDSEYKYSVTLSLTSALDEDGWSMLRPVSIYPPGRETVPIV